VTTGGERTKERGKDVNTEIAAIQNPRRCGSHHEVCCIYVKLIALVRNKLWMTMVYEPDG
jgi:hypothetical protein